jgi:predicted transcriptional regulator
MARIPFSLRIDAEDRTALEHLSELEGRSINQLVNEAIKIFLNQERPKQAGLEASRLALQKNARSPRLWMPKSATKISLKASR